MRDHRIRRDSRGEAASARRSAPPGVPGLRLRRPRAARGRPARLRTRGRQPLLPRRGLERERVRVDARARPHALGDPRRCQRAERPSADRLRARPPGDRPQRDRRELRRAARAAGGFRPHVPLRDGRRGRNPPPRAGVRGRPRAGARPRLPAARGALLDRRDPPRPCRPARRRALPDTPRRGPRRGRELPRLLDRRLPQRDAHRPSPRRRRGRGGDAGGRALLRRRGRDRRAGAAGDRLGRGERREVAASRRSC